MGETSPSFRRRLQTVSGNGNLLGVSPCSETNRQSRTYPDTHSDFPNYVRDTLVKTMTEACRCQSAEDSPRCFCKFPHGFYRATEAMGTAGGPQCLGLGHWARGSV